MVYLLSENSLIVLKQKPLDANLFRVYTQRLLLQNTKVYQRLMFFCSRMGIFTTTTTFPGPVYYSPLPGMTFAA